MRLIAASTLDDYRRSGAYLIDLRTKEEYEQLVKEIVTYFQEQIQSVVKNPLYFID